MVGSPLRAPSARGSATSAVLALGLPLMALLVLRPWVPAPFPIWDTGEILPLLHGSNGVLDAVSRLVEYYRPQGRANHLTYLQLALTWSWAGSNPVGWQLQRAALMLGMGLGLSGLAWRLGAPPLLAGLGGLVLLLSVSPVEGWLYLMGEPLGVCLLLAAFALALGYGTTPRWRRDALLLAALALAVLLTKEIMGAALVPVVVAACCHDGTGGWRWPVLDPRTRWLVSALAVVLVLEVLLLAEVLWFAGDGRYAAAYSAEGLGPARVFRLAAAMLLPAWFATSGSGAMLYPSNLLALGLLVIGLVVAWRQRIRPSVAMVAAVLPLVGALVYAPWPRYSAFYGIPFVVGSISLLIAAATVISRQGRAAAAAVAGAMAVLTVFLAMVADRSVKERHAMAGVAEEIALALPRWPGVDSLLMVVPAAGPRRWPVTAVELRRYTLAVAPDTLSGAVPRDITCEELALRLQSGISRVAVVSDARPCGPLPIRTGVHVRAYRYLDWLTFRYLTDSVAVETLVPSVAARPGPAD